MTCDVADEETDFASRAYFIMIFAYWVPCGLRSFSGTPLY